MLPIKAEFLPLDSKYYGTKIKLTYPDDDESLISLWIQDDYTPSVRELESHGYTKDDWDQNIEIDNGWEGRVKIQQGEIYDSGHFESESTLELAILIRDTINNLSRH